MSDPRSLVILAEGFEEIEAITVIDVLRRASIEVTVASLSGASPVCGAHAIGVVADAPLSEASVAAYDLLVLPGGLPGSQHLADSPVVIDRVRRQIAEGGFIGAICAAPLVLAAAGVLKGRRLTCYPSVVEQLPGALCTEAAVEQDEWLITGNGPGAALRFALCLVAALRDKQVAAQLAAAMQVE